MTRLKSAAAPTQLAQARALLAQGPAGAVENVDELYAAGLPMGLPGGLTTLALHQREALIEKATTVRRGPRLRG